MRKLRLSLVGTVILTMLGGVGALSQSGEEPGQADRVEDVLFEIVVPLVAVPDQLSKINLESQVVEAGVDATIDTRNEAIRGRALHVDAGTLVIEPMAESLLWPAAANGDPPLTVAAGEPVVLSLGDTILLPAIPDEQLDPGAVVRISNTGTEPAMTIGFHLHQAGGGFPGWPQGISGIGSPTTADATAMARVSAGDTVFRLTRSILEPGSMVPIPADALLRLYRVEAGQIDATVAGPSGETVRTWQTGGGGEAIVSEVLDWRLEAAGEGPTSVLALVALPRVIDQVSGE